VIDICDCLAEVVNSQKQSDFFSPPSSAVGDNYSSSYDSYLRIFVTV